MRLSGKETSSQTRASFGRNRFHGYSLRQEILKGAMTEFAGFQATDTLRFGRVVGGYTPELEKRGPNFTSQMREGPFWGFYRGGSV